MGQSSLMGQPLKKVPSVPITDANLGVSASSFRISDSLNSNEQLIRNRPPVCLLHTICIPQSSIGTVHFVFLCSLPPWKMLI